MLTFSIPSITRTDNKSLSQIGRVWDSSPRTPAGLSRRPTPRKANNGSASEHFGDARGANRGRQLLTIAPRYFYPQIRMCLQ